MSLSWILENDIFYRRDDDLDDAADENDFPKADEYREMMVECLSCSFVRRFDRQRWESHRLILHFPRQKADRRLTRTRPFFYEYSRDTRQQ